MTRGLAAEMLLGLPVQHQGIQLGRAADLVLEAGSLRAVGVEVRCVDGETRFLPLPAARVREGRIEVASALLLLEEDSFYRARSRTLGSMRGLPVAQGRTQLGTLVDVVLAEDGTILELVLAGEAGEERVRVDDGIHIVDGDGNGARAR